MHLFDRYGTSVLLGGVGALLTLDPLHGLARGSFREKFGFPAWFVPCVGLWELSITYLNIFGGENQGLAQKLLAVLMGGAIYSHAVAEGNPAGSVGAIVFLGFSCAVFSFHFPTISQNCCHDFFLSSFYFVAHFLSHI